MKRFCGNHTTTKSKMNLQNYMKNLTTLDRAYKDFKNRIEG